MSGTDRFFRPLTPVSTLVAALDAWAAEAPAAAWLAYYHFAVLPVPDALWRDDPVLAGLAARHPFRAGLVRLPPHVMYGWHTDVDLRRGVAVNLLVRHQHSHTWFTPAAAGGFMLPLVEIVYQPATYYCFNTQAPHAVVNGAGERLLLSLEFVEDHHALTYPALVAEAAALGWLAEGGPGLAPASRTRDT